MKKQFQPFLFASAVLLCLIAWSIGSNQSVEAQIAASPSRSATTGNARNANDLNDAGTTDLTPEERANIRVYQTVNSSVVSITTSMVRYDSVFGLPVSGESEGAGSGAVLDRQGHIITNYHVVEDANEISVTFANNKTYEAKLIGADAEYDIAVLKIDAPAEELTPIAIGRSDIVNVGQKAYVLGNPFGLGGTLTTGIVSNLNRSLPSRVEGRAMTGMIQTDAAMNPGNSGGPLLNSSAEMIGMCVAIRSSVGQNSGIGFAIPINRIRRFVPELIEHGKVIRAYHGIVMLNETNRGLRLARLSPNGPAEKAGLRGFREVVRNYRRGSVVYREVSIDKDYADFLLAVNNKPVQTHEEFIRIMDDFKPNDRVAFTILREGKQQQVTVTLGAT